jgi:membrane protease YdiL (CAAX protease family)
MVKKESLKILFGLLLIIAVDVIIHIILNFIPFIWQIFHADLVNISVQVLMLISGLLIFYFLINKDVLQLGYCRKDRLPVAKYVIFFSLASLIGLILSYTFVYLFDNDTFVSVASGRLLNFGGFIKKALMTGILPGIAEETLYRGALVSPFLFGVWNKNEQVTKKKMLIIILVSASIFSLAHVNILFDSFRITYDIYQLVTAFIMGSIEAYVFIKTRNLWGSILIHNIWNIMVLIVVQLIILFN